MNKVITLQKDTPRILLFTGTMIAVLVVSLLIVQNTFAAISSQLDFGDRGSEVTELQAYLSTNASIYPSGLVTGYFGPLTQAGVQKFQAAEGIVSAGTPATTGYGRVGPRTQAAINAKLVGDFNPNPGSSGDIDAPLITSVNVDADNNDASITWTTDKASMGRVYYSTSPIEITQIFDKTGVFVVSGNLAQYDGVARVNHTTHINNLTSNTTYYYLVVVFDSSNNVNITSPASFRTQ